MATTVGSAKPDWPMTQSVFEGGEISGRALARRYSLSYIAIEKRAGSENWTLPVRSRWSRKCPQK
jgi:hypothetical protein